MLLILHEVISYDADLHSICKGTALGDFDKEVRFIYKRICELEERIPSSLEIHDHLLETAIDYGITMWSYHNDVIPGHMLFSSLEQILDLEHIAYIDENGTEVNDAQIVLLESV